MVILFGSHARGGWMEDYQENTEYKKCCNQAGGSAGAFAINWLSGVLETGSRSAAFYCETVSGLLDEKLLYFFRFLVFLF